MAEKLLKQAGICLLIALAIFISKQSHIDVLEQGADAVLKQVSVHYSTEDMKVFAEKGASAAVSLPAKVTEAAGVMTAKPVYGDPIDGDFQGSKTPVHAVGAGQVTAVGENEEIGKYVKITHSDDGESLYGNLKSVYVSVPSNVKKGQIIGLYQKEEEKDFYYSFKEFQ